jgi:hypothetical protein
MKGNFLLSILTLFLAVLAYTERRAAPPPSAVPSSAVSSEPLFALRPEEIDAIKVVDQNGCLVVGRKAMSSLYGRALMESIIQARVIRRFPPSAADFSSYGLIHSVRRVEVLHVDGKPMLIVDVGNLNPVRDAVYARIQGGPEVLLIGSYFLTALDMAVQGVRANEGGTADYACTN